MGGALPFLQFSVPVAYAADPGNVSGASHWLRADAGVFNDSCGGTSASTTEDVACWDDQTATNNDSSPLTNAPQYVTGAINGNPALLFDSANSEDLQIAAGVLPTSANTDPYTHFIIFAPTADGFIEQGGGAGGDRVNIRTQAAALSATVSGLTVTDNTWIGNNAVPRILALRKVDETADNTFWYIDGEVWTTTTDDSTHSAAATLLPKSAYGGYLMETITFNAAALSAANQNKVESYLAIKYGITLGSDTDGDTTGFETGEGDYTSSGGVVVWDADIDTSYHNDIAGIADDSTNSELSQTSSKSENTDAIAQVHTASSLDLDDFLLWGNNNGAATWTATGAPTNYEILSREWMVQETGNVGTVSIDIDVADSGFDVPATGSGDYYFIYDTDGDGLYTDETPAVMSDQGSDIWRITGVDFDDEDEFTIARSTSTPAITYSAATFTESTQNDGTIDNSTPITATLSNDTYQDTDADDVLDVGSEVLVTNLSTGLTAAMALSVGDTVASITLTGTASAADNSNDVSDLTIAFQDSAFTGGSAAAVTNATKSDLVIDYRDVTLAYSSSTFTEDVANDGSISNTLTITLGGTGSTETFVISGGPMSGDGTHYTAANVPTGLTAVLTGTSTTTATLTLTGNATLHANANDVANLTITFAADAFTIINTASNVENYAKSDIAVDFGDVIIAYSSGTLNEAGSNDGTVTETLTLTLSGDTFVISGSAMSGDGTHYTASNVPNGLTAVLTGTSTTTATLALTGTAIAHANTDDVANLTITFAADAFTNVTTASTVTNYAKSDIIVDFDDPVSSGGGGGGSSSGSTTGGSAAATTTVTTNQNGISSQQQQQIVANIVEVLTVLNATGISEETRQAIIPLVLQLIFSEITGLPLVLPAGDNTTPITPATPVDNGPTAKELELSGEACVPLSVGTLQSGDKGDHVKRLQRHFWDLGYGTTIDGSYGSGTKDAVTFFQLESGATADGVVGAGTIAMLEQASCGAVITNTAEEFLTTGEFNAGQIVCPIPVGAATLRSGDSGIPVGNLQRILKNGGFYTGAIDSQYGAGTVAAVKSLQTAKGLTVDGTAGAATYAVLAEYCDSSPGSTTSSNNPNAEGSTNTAATTGIIPTPVETEPASTGSIQLSN